MRDILKSGIRFVVFAYFLLEIFLLPSRVFPVEIYDLYSELASQLRVGKPLIITSYIGLWCDNQENPEQNLYWGNMGGHYFLFNQSRNNIKRGICILQEIDWLA